MLVFLPKVKNETDILGDVIGVCDVSELADNFSTEVSGRNNTITKFVFPVVTLLMVDSNLPTYALQINVLGDSDLLPNFRPWESMGTLLTRRTGLRLYSGTKIFEKVKLTFQESINPIIFQSLKSESFIPIVSKELVHRFTVTITGETLQDNTDTVRWPAGPWNAFKEKYFPNWLLNKFPVCYVTRTVRFDRKLYYPTFNYKFQGHKAYIHEELHIIQETPLKLEEESNNDGKT